MSAQRGVTYRTGMKPRLPFMLAGVGVAMVLMTGVVLYAAPTRSAEATSFARPNFEPPRESTALDLNRFSALARKEDLARLAKAPQACHDALNIAGVDYARIQPIRTGKGCGVEDAVVLDRSMLWQKSKEPLPMTCAMAARLYLWETQVVAPAAEKHFGVPLQRIEALGAYSCRTIAGETKMSEHAFGKAADIAGFRLADGRMISVLDHYYDKGPKGAFLREVHEKACDLFDVTLGPDYNEAHKNHFHIDVGIRRACH